MEDRRDGRHEPELGFRDIVSEWGKGVEKGILGDRNNINKGRCPHWGWLGE